MAGPSGRGITATVHGRNLTAGIVECGSTLASTTSPSAPAGAFDRTATDAPSSARRHHRRLEELSVHSGPDAGGTSLTYTG